MAGDEFWKLEHLSDGELLANTLTLVASCRRRTAELVAHLGEVESRRLHLAAACGSMFEYCVKRLRLSEDEACRRIDVARLGRRFPALFCRLASGDLSLTVAAALKPHLSEQNHAELLAAVAGKSVQQAREALASLFPRPDVATSMRQLPEPRKQPRASVALALGGAQAANPESATASPLIGSSPDIRSAPAPMEALSFAAATLPPTLMRPLSSALARKAAPIEALSGTRYRVQFTASSALKGKLERARDLMRHRNPNGDLAVVVERSIDLLLEQLMKERFGAACQPRSSCTSSPRHVSQATRRAVLERDGLQCSWRDPEGHRCESRAWLEFDHRQPRGKGGGSDPDNVRLLCRAHNQLAAEQEYGREHIENAIVKGRRGGERSGVTT